MLLWALPAAMAVAGDFVADLQAVRDLAGADPEAARRELAALRDRALAAGRIDSRLSVDEADCRLLTDIDPARARSTALAGVQAATEYSPLPASATLPLLRLRACAAGAHVDEGAEVPGMAELDAVIADAQGDAALAPARALGLLERGHHRSRAGQFVEGQADLIAACSALSAPVLARDLELCEWHLANHYKRVGDTDEALSLLNRLLAAAERRNATVDVSVYVFGLAQVHFERREWPQALQRFRQALAMSEALQDRNGLIYAEHCIASTLLALGRAGDALPPVERALALLQGHSDVMQASRSAVVQAQVLDALGRADDAKAVLAGVESAVRGYRNDVMLADWLRTQAAVQAHRGAWRDAYEALAAWRELDGRLQSQRQSQQSARLRVQFNRERDAADVLALRREGEQAERLRHAQAVALALFVVLLSVSLVFVVRKVMQTRQLQRLALADELTGLPNRRAVLAHADEQLGLARRLARPLGLLMIDVDHFKRINDTHGHAVGDEVLRHLGRTLSVGLRTHDRVGRLGGEEFMVVLPDTVPEQARAIAERMRAAVAAGGCVTAAGLQHFTVSIGVACGCLPSDTVASLIDRADAALYAAKHGGRNAVALAMPAA